VDDEPRLFQILRPTGFLDISNNFHPASFAGRVAKFLTAQIMVQKDSIPFLFCQHAQAFDHRGYDRYIRGLEFPQSGMDPFAAIVQEQYIWFLAFHK
jgi:hypothetical protein